MAGCAVTWAPTNGPAGLVTTPSMMLGTDTLIDRPFSSVTKSCGNVWVRLP